MGGFGRQWSIIEGAGRPGLAVYGNPWFSVQAVACTEIISFPYTPSDLDPPGPKIGLKHLKPQVYGKGFLSVHPPALLRLGPLS